MQPPIHFLLCRCLSSSTRRLQPGKALEQGLRHALEIWQAVLRDKARSYLNEVIDLCAADIMRSEIVLSRVTRSCRGSSFVWSNSVYGSRSPPPRTHCAGEYPLSSMAELQAQVTAVVSHVTRCIWLATKLDAELVDQPSCTCLPGSSMPFTDCVLL